jgi:hypothetical protein
MVIMTILVVMVKMLIMFIMFLWFLWLLWLLWLNGYYAYGYCKKVDKILIILKTETSGWGSGSFKRF